MRDSKAIGNTRYGAAYPLVTLNESRMRPDTEIRWADLADMSDIVRLCEEHAAYEKADYVPTCERDLQNLLFGANPPLNCLVAHASGGVRAFSTFAIQVSTWRAAPYLYMDCLYVTAGYRREGLGQQLVHRVFREARQRHCTEVQWQTPEFNAQALAFYDRLPGTQRHAKWRYHCQLLE